MTVASGLYGPTLVKMLTNAAAIDLSAETMKCGMVTDTHTPNFDLHDFYADITNEVTGTAYTAGGALLTGTTVVATGGILTFDAADVSWASSTISNAEAAFIYADGVTDELVCMSDFLAPASSSGGTFTIQWSASGIFTIDYTP